MQQVLLVSSAKTGVEAVLQAEGWKHGPCLQFTLDILPQLPQCEHHSILHQSLSETLAVML